VSESIPLGAHARVRGNMSWTSVIPPILDWSFRILGLTTHVRVRTYLGQFFGKDGEPGTVALFVNVTNVSLAQDAEITHVWIETARGQVAPDHYQRPLPVRLRPKQTWETWVSLKALMAADPTNADQLARVRLSDGRVVKGRPDRNVPHAGYVAGGAHTSR
jgi:hypothetical protein